MTARMHDDLRPAFESALTAWRGRAKMREAIGEARECLLVAALAFARGDVGAQALCDAADAYGLAVESSREVIPGLERARRIRAAAARAPA